MLRSFITACAVQTSTDTFAYSRIHMQTLNEHEVSLANSHACVRGQIIVAQHVVHAP